MTNNSTTDNRRKRLVFQSNHRGCKEMDMIMGQFAERCAASMSDAELTIYEAMLEEDDWDLYAWVNGSAVPGNEAYNPLIEKMREYTPLVKQQMQS